MSRGTRILVAELLGTMILIIGGPGAVVIGATIGLKVGVLGVALGFGLALLCAAYMIGSISGCHINPAVTISLWAMKKTETHLVLYYIVGQVIGALVGAGLLALILDTGNYTTSKRLGTQDLFTIASNGYGSHSPGGFALGSVIITEILFTGIFLLVIASTTRKSMPAGFTGLAVGLMLTLVHIVMIPIDNASVNPARSLATAVYADSWALKQVWVFIVFPIVGGVIAAGIWKVLVQPEDA